MKLQTTHQHPGAWTPTKNKGLRSIFAIAIVAAIAGSLQAQILEYRFNTSGSTQSSDGSSSQSITTKDGANVNTDYISASTTGVSGLAGDSALDFSSATWQTAGPKGQGAVLSDLNGLSSFTIAGWAKNADTSTNGIGRIFYDSSSGAGIDLLYTTTGSQKQLSLSVNGAAGVASTATQYSGFASSNWTFFAVTYDGSSGAVQFYSGATTGSLTLSTATFGTNPGNVGTIASSFYVGNASTGNRPFDGWLDNFRIYGSTSGTAGILSSTELLDIRNYDFTTVPEPNATAAFFAMGAVLFIVTRRKLGASSFRRASS